MLKEEIILLVPPFHSIDRPSIGLEIIKAIGSKNNFTVKIVYTNLILAKIVGPKLYTEICNSNTDMFLGEAFFSSGSLQHSAFEHLADNLNDINIDLLYSYRLKFENEIKDILKFNNAKIIGTTVLFQQMNSALMLLNIARQENNLAVTIIGGGGLQGNILDSFMELENQLCPNTIDFYFQGEGEFEFEKFLIEFRLGELNRHSKIKKSQTRYDLTLTPQIDYEDYFKQLSELFPEIDQTSLWIPFETSRGCWFGMISHCTFCGLNTDEMSYRKKTVKNSIYALRSLLESSPTRKFVLVDSILPRNYISTFFKEVKSLNAHFFFEQKAPLSFNEAKVISDAGTLAIQPGIESLSTKLLSEMGKKTTLKQNIELLRHSRIFEIYVEWNFLHGIPNENMDEYFNVKRFIFLLEHLNPPSRFSHISIVKFSPYFNSPEKFGIKNLTPSQNYKKCFPDQIDFFKIATHFQGDYDKLETMNPELFLEFVKIIKFWQDSWRSKVPLLQVIEYDKEKYMLIDTRECSKQMWTLLDKNMAKIVLFDGLDDFQLIKWSIQNGYGIIDGDDYIPLATCSEDTYQKLL